CMEGLTRHPDCLTGRVVLGRCYLEQEKLKEAAAEFVTVLKLDRRNHTAIKMIADICARQGLKEKAGDLYASLLGMDPDNQSLVELASTFRGTGDTDLFSILGMASSVTGRAAVVAPAAHDTIADDIIADGTLADDTIADADRTLKFDVEPSRPAVSAAEETEVGEMMAKTQQFDPKDLGVADRVHDDTVLAEDVLTGDDVSSRMETMFEIGPETPPAAAPEVHEHIELGEGEETVGPSDDAGAATVRGEDAGVVSGSDITSRIEQLFGEEMPVVPPEPTVAEAPIREVALDELRPVEASALSGEDITSRLNEMFEGEPAIEPLSEETPKGKPVLPADTKVGPLLEIGAEAPAGTVTGATEEIVVGPREQARQPAGGNVLSGDDVALRLDTIFDEGEEAGPPANEAVATQSAEATDLSTADGDKTQTADVFRAGEDTKPPLDIEEVGVAVDEVGFDAAAETLVVEGAGTSPLAAASQEPPEASEAPIIIDDAVAAEEQEPESGMSGDDVVGRMEEIFSEEPVPDKAAAPAAPAKEEAAMHLDFIPVTEEEAGASQAPGSAPTDVDKTDVAPPESDTLDLSGETEERTILMDEDSGAETMPAEDETMVARAEAETMAVEDEAETMVWSRSDPFLDSPFRTGSKTGTGASKETESVTPREPEQDIFKEQEKGAGAESDLAFSIPDHVLTPTLADIYYQQGQPRLALQIFRRLLDADPDNERIAKRIREIEAGLNAGLEATGVEETVVSALEAGKDAKPPVPRVKPKVDKKKKTAAAEKPLTGVRIRKKVKTRRRKTR
ncbi:MAG TPA: tetratricopeptide repeat protein, partial [Chitinivibrionales bacterium]|nr:tetratricopeptide repeat protein [Chitinivibrionales bacterium]